MRFVLWFMAAALASATPGGARAQSELREILAAPVEVEHGESATAVPIELRGGKLFIEATANGETRSFIFDTGSPSMISRRLAEQLGLEIVGRNTGRDAHGAEVTTGIAILDTLTIGEATFRNVPVTVFDFSHLSLGPCFIDGGIIGSEIFPGSVWRIDLQDRRLTIAESAAALDPAAIAVDAELLDFGYPHAPVVGYAIGGTADRALFDTGNAEEVALYSRLMDDDGIRASILDDSLQTGRGSEGESAGGRAATGDLLRFELTGLQVDGTPLGNVRATSRALPPTLLGAGLLQRYVVTLDYPGGRFLLEDRSAPAPIRPHPGFAIGFVGDSARVVQLFDASPAAAVGLRLNDEVVAIDERSLVVDTGNDRCTSARWLVEAFAPSSGTEIVVRRDGERITFPLPPSTAN